MPELLASPSVFFAPLLCALVCFSAIWPLSVWRRDASLVDLAWGPGFLVQLAISGLFLPELGERAILLLSVVGIWSLRLSWTLTGRRIREGHEDPRYTSLRASWGRPFWWKSFFVVFLLQGFLQWVIVLGPISGMAAGDQSLHALAWVGCCIALVGLVLESIADWQLDRFKSRHGETSALMSSGLRAHVRHPNYLGEILFWIGVSLIVLESSLIIGLLSPVLIAFVLTKVSGIPLIEERMLATRPEYEAYRRTVPALLPKLQLLY